ncbi:hypothetical protein [uncultured Pseudosulfitobacter sp.]|uniref:hypothetical protein n=1 Tax=uncultured Pseudosulfitobacter sp. TaxID=2854214 RepID=UPI0030D6EF1A|tara:strand:- start:242 stop:922 length:681 start_codon:yes stop_codon:yes gene_type:complete
MRMSFWLLVLLWVLSVIARAIVAIRTFQHVGLATNYYWGTKFFLGYILVELFLLLCLGAAAYARDRGKMWPWPKIGLLALFASIGLHFATMETAIGFLERFTITGERHIVDWSYNPHVYDDRKGHQALHIRLKMPGYRPIYSERREGDASVFVEKATSAKVLAPYNFPQAEADPYAAECIMGTCRFYKDGAWYVIDYPHGHSTEGMLEELQIEIPALFDSFIKPRG